MDTHVGFVDSNGTRLHYETAGAGDLLVLIHGETLDLRMWDDQFLPFARHYQVIRYDMGGYGQSAFAMSATLVTRNRRDFGVIEGLRIEDGTVDR